MVNIANMSVTVFYILMHCEAVTVEVCLYLRISSGKPTFAGLAQGNPHLPDKLRKTHICRVPDNYYWMYVSQGCWISSWGPYIVKCWRFNSYKGITVKILAHKNHKRYGLNMV